MKKNKTKTELLIDIEKELIDIYDKTERKDITGTGVQNRVNYCLNILKILLKRK